MFTHYQDFDAATLSSTAYSRSTRMGSLSSDVPDDENTNVKSKLKLDDTPRNETAQLAGLKNFLREWYGGQWDLHERNPESFDFQERLKVQLAVLEQEEAKKLEQEEKETEEKIRQKEEQGMREAAKASIYSTYAKSAAQEDKQLVSRWTETLNILLTFAGLQSAIVTAFILALDPNLKPNPMNTTNQLLQQVLHRLDNSTAITITADNDWTAPSSAVRVSAWWYTSLACSLLSAFGALLGKQWILHYRSQPSWANTSQKQAELRAARHHSLAIWWFSGIIESFPILLQSSLLFFAIGIADYMHLTSSPLFFLIASFIGFGVLFFGVTLIAGTFLPTCPFKSPVTQLFFGIGHYLSLRARYLAEILLATLSCFQGWMTDNHKLAQQARRTLYTKWSIFTSFNFRHWAEEDHGVSTRTQEAFVGTAAVLWWWVEQCAQSAGREHGQDRLNDIKSAVDVLVSLPPQPVAEYFSTMAVPGFAPWAGDTLSMLWNHSEESVLNADILCYLMYQSPQATQIALASVPNLQGAGVFCRRLRELWTHKKSPPQLPFPSMKWTTIIVYLRQQLSVWCEKTHVDEDLPFLSDIIVELPVLLEDVRLATTLADVAVAASVAAVALVDDGVPGICSRAELLSSEPFDQLVLALLRLSYYPQDTSALGPHHPFRSPGKLFKTLVWAFASTLNKERKALGGPRLAAKLVKCRTWSNGQLGELISRLLDIGIPLRDLEDSPSCKEAPVETFGGAMVWEVFGLIQSVYFPFTMRPQLHAGELGSLPSSAGLTSIIRGSAHKHKISPYNEHIWTALDTILGFRYYKSLHPSPFALNYRPYQSAPAHPQPSLPISLLHDNPEILSQMIQDVEAALHAPDPASRRLVLSVIVKGKDFFLPPDPTGRYCALAQDLASIAERMVESGTLWSVGWSLDSSIRSAIDAFSRWDDLLQALKGASIPHVVRGRKSSIESDLVGHSFGAQILVYSPQAFGANLSSRSL